MYLTHGSDPPCSISPSPVVPRSLISDLHTTEPAETGVMQCGCCGVQLAGLPIVPDNTADFFSKYLSLDDLGRMQTVNRENRDDITNKPKRGTVVKEFWRSWKEACAALEERLKTRLPEHKQYGRHDWHDVTFVDARIIIDRVTKSIQTILSTPNLELLLEYAIPDLEFVRNTCLHAHVILPEAGTAEAGTDEDVADKFAFLNLDGPRPTYVPPPEDANRGLDVLFDELERLVNRLYWILKSIS